MVWIVGYLIPSLKRVKQMFILVLYIGLRTAHIENPNDWLSLDNFQFLKTVFIRFEMSSLAKFNKGAAS